MRPMGAMALVAVVVSMVTVPLASVGQARQLVIIASGWVVGVYYPTLETIPGGAYKGLAGPVATLAVRAMVVARAELPEDMVYRFTRAIFDNLEQIHAADVATRSLTVPTALRGRPIPVHPGAARFFTERGVSPKEVP